MGAPDCPEGHSDTHAQAIGRKAYFCEVCEEEFGSDQTPIG